MRPIETVRQNRPFAHPALFLAAGLVAFTCELAAEQGSGSTLSENAADTPRFGFKPVDPASLEAAPRIRGQEQIPRSVSNPSAIGLRSRPDKRQERLSRDLSGPGVRSSTPPEAPDFAVERLPDMQTLGRSPRTRRYGSITGSSGRSRGVGGYP